MNTRDIILNIAVNLGRLGRWAHEKNYKRIPKFIEDNNYYLTLLESSEKNIRLERTIKVFLDRYEKLVDESSYSEKWADEMFTWSNILTHRSKLA